MPNTFKSGDVVQLKSGGPVMTVWSQNGQNVACTWFKNNNDGPHHEAFPPDMLELVPESAEAIVP